DDRAHLRRARQRAEHHRALLRHFARRVDAARSALLEVRGRVARCVAHHELVTRVQQSHRDRVAHRAGADEAELGQGDSSQRALYHRAMRPLALVVGGDGRIARVLIPALAREGYEVVATTRRVRGETGWLELDLAEVARRGPPRLPECDVVFLCAAMSG